MPTNYERYYGFTRFAIELNELDPLLKDLLPATDARFRPDQRQECLFIHLIFGGLKAEFCILSVSSLQSELNCGGFCW